MNNQFLAFTKIPINQLSLLILGPTVSTRGSRSHKRRPHAYRPTTGRARNKRCRQNIFDPQIFTPDHLRLSRPTTGGARKKHCRQNIFNPQIFISEIICGRNYKEQREGRRGQEREATPSGGLK